MSDLTTNLRGLAECQHDDHSVAGEAAARVAGLEAELANLRDLAQAQGVADGISIATARRAALEEAAKKVGNLRGRDVQKRDAEAVGEAYDLAIDKAQAAIRALVDNH